MFQDSACTAICHKASSALLERKVYAWWPLGSALAFIPDGRLSRPAVSGPGPFLPNM